MLILIPGLKKQTGISENVETFTGNFSTQSYATQSATIPNKKNLFSFPFNYFLFQNYISELEFQKIMRVSLEGSSLILIQHKMLRP